jgi:polyphosphate kinase
VHLGTGNYNPTTARIYTDLGLLSAREDLAQDVADLFNMITGYSRVPAMSRLVVAPFTFRKRLLQWIDREARNAQAGKPARIRAKMNALSDSEVIRALYAAGQAGVRIELCVRGICCLRPGVPGLSENIRVVSIVDRFLEHSRIFCFENGGDPELWVGSADWMTRNLDRRVEVLFPILDPALRKRLLDEILATSLADNVKAREVLADGGFRRAPRPESETATRSQSVFVEQAQRRRQLPQLEEPGREPQKVRRRRVRRAET